MEYIKLEPGWLMREIERTREEMKEWPEWFRNAPSDLPQESDLTNPKLPVK